MRKKMLWVPLMLCLVMVVTLPVAAQLDDQFDDQLPEDDLTIDMTDPRIQDITIVGNENISDEEIMEVIQLEPGDRLDEDMLRDDLQAIFDLDYFQSVAPDFKQREAEIELVVNVTENPILQEINFTGTKVYEREELLELLGVQPGELLNMGKLAAGLRNIEQSLESDGYFPVFSYPGSYHFLDFDNIIITPTGELTIPIGVGILGDVIIDGNEKTQDFVILREITLEEGEPLTIPKIQENMHRLYMLEYFEEIIPEPVQYSDGQEIDLVLNFQERDTGTLHLGGSWSSAEGAIGTIQLQEKNLLGQGQRIGFMWEFGGTHNLSLDFHEPRFRGSEMSLGFSLYDREKRVGNIDERGGSITVGHPIEDNWDGSIRYKLVDEWQYDDDDELIDSGRISSITFNATQDTRNHYFNPSEGNLMNFSLELASSFLGSDSSFAKLNSDIRRYIPGFEEDQAWALRFKTGLANSVLPSGQKFRLGGSETLRGYDFGEFSGEYLLLTNVEYRFLLEDNFTGVLFGDMGNVWDYDQSIDLGNLRYALGLGLRMDTPVGQIRLDYGWNDRAEGKPHFSIGQTF